MVLERNFPDKHFAHIAQVGQKVDAVPSTVVSVIPLGDEPIPFGSLLVYGQDSVLARIPTAKTHLDHPIGITLKELYGDAHRPKSPIATLRQGRVWVNIKDKDNVTPGEQVYVVISTQGARFTIKATEGATKLNNAIYIDKNHGNLAPIELNFMGGGQ